MAIEMVRVPSDTPNITNTDDFVGLRYAYGNQNGYVKDKGLEIDYEINGSDFVIKSGRLILQGVECDIDANGVTISVDTIQQNRFYSVYLKVDLLSNTATILSEYSTSSYPVIDSGDDLTQNNVGVARLLLYTFDTNNGIVSNVKKKVNVAVYPYIPIKKHIEDVFYINGSPFIVPYDAYVINGEILPTLEVLWQGRSDTNPVITLDKPWEDFDTLLIEYQFDTTALRPVSMIVRVAKDLTNIVTPVVFVPLIGQGYVPVHTNNDPDRKTLVFSNGFRYGDNSTARIRVTRVARINYGRSYHLS